VRAPRVRRVLLNGVLILGACVPATTPSTAGEPTDFVGRSPAPTISVEVLPKGDRPNFVLILVDDLDARLGTMEHMPNVQALLVQQGLQLDGFYVTDPTCCPSRTSILRGEYTHTHQIYTSAPGEGFQRFYELDHDSSTLATWLQAAGYQTAFYGKYLNGYPLPEDRSYVPQGWNTWYSPARGKPYTGFDYTLNENGLLVSYGSEADDYLIDVLAAKVEDFLANPDRGEQPFFILLAPYQPHEPADPAPRHESLFEGLAAPRTPSFNEPDVLDKPDHIKFDPVLNEARIRDLDDLYVNRLRSMQSVDEAVARIFRALEAGGALEDTFVIFTSDNGYHLGQHRMPAGKSTAYEEDVRVPFVIRGPGVPADRLLSGYLSGNVDIAPTIAELAGVVPPATVEGRSLVPLLSAPTNGLEWRSGFLIEYYHGAEEEAGGTHRARYADPDGILEPPDPDWLFESLPTPAYRGLRTAQYKYVEYAGGFRELYDLVVDPFELDNLVGRVDPALVQNLSAWLLQFATCSGASCRIADSASPQ